MARGGAYFAPELGTAAVTQGRESPQPLGRVARHGARRHSTGTKGGDGVER